MDNELKRRLIRHLEQACRDYHRRLDPTPSARHRGLDVELLSNAELAAAIDDCIRLIVLLKR